VETPKVKKLKQQLQGGTAPHEPVKPQKSSQPQQPNQPPPNQAPPARKLSVAEQAAAAELRTRQQRGLIRRPMSRGEPPPDRFLVWADLFELGVITSKTQARRLWERGAFPRPVHLSERTIAFRESEILAWMASRQASWQLPDEAA
jgi:predicted DNA-binding transcriptional regulator AlpA